MPPTRLLSSRGPSSTSPPSSSRTHLYGPGLTTTTTSSPSTSRTAAPPSSALPRVISGKSPSTPSCPRVSWSLVWVEPGDDFTNGEPVEFAYEDQVNSDNFADAGTDDTVPDDALELKWEFDEDSRRYYVSFPDDQ
uniref:Uncharacterized protein n=1 Tax=Triticum urartu TaxID=4572 RepID=A0A8R7V1S5_TRIUA